MGELIQLRPRGAILPGQLTTDGRVYDPTDTYRAELNLQLTNRRRAKTMKRIVWLTQRIEELRGILASN